MTRTIAERGDAVLALGEVFREHGYEGASLALISERTGLGRSSLYHFFPGGKQDMGEAVLGEIHAWFETYVFAPLMNDAPAIESLDTMFAAVAQYFRSGQRVCIAGVFALTETRDRFAERVRQYFDQWRAHITHILVKAGLDAQRARAAAEDIIIRIQGALVLARSQSEPPIFTRALERMRREIALELEARSSGS